MNLCKECGSEMRWVFDIKDPVDGYPETRVYQCPKCKTIDI